MAVPRFVDGIGGPVVGMSGGANHSLVAAAEGRVLVFGSGAEGSLGLGAEGSLGLGAEVEEALTPTAIDGITMGEEDEGNEG